VLTRILLSLLLSVGTLCTLIGQDLPLRRYTRAEGLASYKFERISTEHGLSHATVTDMIQDRRGFIWIATPDGLNRFDGYTCAVYKHRPEDSTSISSNFIHGICEDRSGTLWITTREGGLNRFDHATERFMRYRHDPRNPQSIANNKVGPIMEDSKGRLWVGGDGGLDIFDRENEIFIHHQYNSADPFSLSYNEITAVYEDRSGTLWVGTVVGLNRFDPESGRFTRFLHKASDVSTISNNFVYTVYEDAKGNLWVGTAEGLNLMDRETGRFNRTPLGLRASAALKRVAIARIYEDSRGFLWFGTPGFGLFQYNPQTGTLMNLKNDPNNNSSISHNNLQPKFEDRSGTLWVGTWGAGINTLARTKKKFQHMQNDPANPVSLSNNFVFALHEDRRGLLWVGTAGGGLNKHDKSTGTVRHFKASSSPVSLNNNTVWSIAEGAGGFLWIGTQDGLSLFDTERETFKQFRHDPSDPTSLGGIVVKSLFLDRKGTLWVGFGEGGLSRRDRATSRWVRYLHNPNDAKSIGRGQVWAMAEDRDGILLIGTFSGGLCLLDRTSGTFTRYTHNPADSTSLSFNDVRGIHVAKEGTIWIATYGGGLNKFDRATGRFHRYTTQHGIANNFLYGILEDETGKLWISSNRGISRFDPRTETFKNFSTEDGLQADEFNTGAFFKSRSGEMFFGGVNGFNRFYPSAVKDNPHIPPVVITSFKVFDKEARLDTSITAVKKISLRYSQNFFSFEFAALHYVNPTKNQYAYRLEGFDREWIYSGTRRYASYTNLDPGQYVFHAKGSNHDGVWNEEGVSVQVVIVPPFWQQWWFRGIMVLLVVGTFGGIVRFISTRKLRKQLQELEKQRALQDERQRTRDAIARDLHDDLASTVSTAGIFTDALQRHIAPGTEANELVEKMRGLIFEAQETMSDLVWSVSPLHDSVESVITRIQLYAHDIARTDRFESIVNVIGDNSSTVLPGDVRRAFYLVFKEALANCVRHSRATLVTINIGYTDNSLVLKICDNGIGFQFDTVNTMTYGGNGISNMRKRAEEIGAEVLIASSQKMGTEIILTKRMTQMSY
jgi:two-component system sensor histidine kinase ChiS